MSRLRWASNPSASHGRPRTAKDLARAARDHADELGFRVWWRRHPRVRLDEPIFLVGCPRSGTSLAVRLLATHPDLATWSEAGRIWDPVGYDDPTASHQWTAHDARVPDPRRLHARFERYRQQAGKQRFLNKHPRNSVRLDYLAEAFPDARFVHIIRDGRAVASSIVARVRREPWRLDIPFGGFCKPPGWEGLLRDDPYEQAALQWREIVGFVLARRESLGDRYHEFRYEDLCAAPREVIGDVFSFAGLPAGSDVVDRLPSELQNRTALYRCDVDEREVRTMESVQRDLLVRLGYPLHHG